MSINKHSLLLNTGSEIPQLGLGTWGIDKANDLAQMFNTGIQCGYRHFDSAAMYFNEHLTGKLLSQHIGNTVSREEIFITSKLANNVHAPKRVRPAIIQTLQDLQLDYLDLYLMHWPMATFDHGLQAYDPEELKVSYIETYPSNGSLATRRFNESNWNLQHQYTATQSSHVQMQYQTSYRPDGSPSLF